MPNILNKLPKSVLNVLNILINNGYQAYVVGGAVRDILLNRKVSDYDICTNALPDETRKVFLNNNYKVIETGLKHGTITIISNNVSFEVTTFRIDGKYEDKRHPDNVKFVSNLEEDLKRRDFTINALASDIGGNIVDYHHGFEDLQNKIIRTVGLPQKRFEEDALRMLRAIRFSAVLQFSIDEDTMNAIFDNLTLIKNVSIERINMEVEKILNFSFNIDIKKIANILKFIYDYNFDLNEDDFVTLSRFPDYLMKVAYLYSFYPKNVLDEKLNVLKLSTVKKKNILTLIENSKKIEYNYFSHYTIKKYLSMYGYEMGFLVIQYLCYLNNIDILVIKEKIESLINDIVNIASLDINGDDLLALGYSGKDIGIILNSLVDMVLLGKIKNEKKALIKGIKKVKI